MDSAYDLFARTALLEDGDFHAAAVPLARARELEPDKASVREALGRALFGARRFREAAAEFEAVVEHAPTNDYALFCLGRSLQLLGRHAEARKPLALAVAPAPRARATTRSTSTRPAAARPERGCRADDAGSTSVAEQPVDGHDGRRRLARAARRRTPRPRRRRVDA